MRAQTDDYAHRLYYADSDFKVAERVMKVAKERSAAPTQIALAWLLAQPGVTAPVIGVTRMEHLEQAVAAVPMELDIGERRRLEQPYQPHPVLGHP